jgi:hypothetical protein
LGQATTLTFRREELVKFGTCKEMGFWKIRIPLSVSSPIRHFCRDVAFDLHGFSYYSMTLHGILHTAHCSLLTAHNLQFKVYKLFVSFVLTPFELMEFLPTAVPVYCTLRMALPRHPHLWHGKLETGALQAQNANRLKLTAAWV